MVAQHLYQFDSDRIKFLKKLVIDIFDGAF